MNLEQIERLDARSFHVERSTSNPVIKDTYRGRLHANKGIVQMSGVEDNLEKISRESL
jgi:glucosamine--fructose-6-phosphate aminotransferase (isomerizing)